MQGDRIRGWVNGRLLFDLTNENDPLLRGGVALIVTESCLGSDAVRARQSGEPSGPDA